MEMFPRCAIYQTPKKWKKWPPSSRIVVQHYSPLFLQCSPFRALYGYDPNMIATPVDAATTNPTITDWAEEREAYNELLRTQLLQAQNKMKLQADKNRTPREFQVDEQVLLKLQPYVE
jgi:hypothetical protein